LKTQINQDLLVLLTRANDNYSSLTDIARGCNLDKPRMSSRIGCAIALLSDTWGCGKRSTALFLQEASAMPPNKTKVIGAISIKSAAGHGGGIYAHRGIVPGFASWVSAEFKLYLIKELRRLKERTVTLESVWDIKCCLAIIKNPIVPYSINVAPCNMAVKEWRRQKPYQSGKIREVAAVEQHVVLSNLESLNAAFIRQDLSQPERLMVLNELAIG
jgi:hypothetical protein